MTGHKVETHPRQGGYMARCLDCTAITFGGFPTRTAAREAIAPTHDHEEAPGAVPAAAEGKDTETDTHERPDSMNTVTDTTATVTDLSSYQLHTRGPRPGDEAPAWKLDEQAKTWHLTRFRVVAFPNLGVLRIEALHADDMADALKLGRRIQADGVDLTACKTGESSVGEPYKLLEYGTITDAIKCERPGCNDHDTYPEPVARRSRVDHLCNATTDEQEAAGIDVYFDDEAQQWRASIEDADGTDAKAMRELARMAVYTADQLARLHAGASA
ncbi:hypothetical protein [Pseudoclavibacter helvolus]|uniref:hypothetical protein n=1 Tax=Pseudoclavibacter helvolus TaxID=255205 RepID=UPI000838DAFC|nr:hypothetical protein [Pseudoclavibacter helvolus]